MRKVASAVVVLLAFAIPALSETFHDVPVVDTNCSTKAAANPDAHTRACALKCAASGFGIVTKDQQYLKFDAKGNREIEQELKASNKKDHLRVDVTGEVKNNTLEVKSVRLL